jgi:hypothetical protein
VRFLRPHQREGVAFMFECVTGQRVEGGQGLCVGRRKKSKGGRGPRRMVAVIPRRGISEPLD